MTEPQITIVGGGVVGLCLAAELVERGVSSRIFDRHGRPAERERAVDGVICCVGA